MTLTNLATSLWKIPKDPLTKKSSNALLHLFLMDKFGIYNQKQNTNLLEYKKKKLMDLESTMTNTSFEVINLDLLKSFFLCYESSWKSVEQVIMELEVENVKLQESKLDWGRSLPVQSVQEIVRVDPQCLPERYIQGNSDRPKTTDLCPASSDIPIIDFSLLLSGEKDERAKLHLACKDWGFFQIINHGIAYKVLHEMKLAVSGFFELPLEEKKKYAITGNDFQGYGQIYVVSEQQKLDWGDMIFLLTEPPNYKEPKYWPTSVPGFREAVEQYSKEANKVIGGLLANLSLLMGLNEDSLLTLHGEKKHGIRMNYYPTCSRPDLVLGLSPHSDSSSVTLLVQDDETTGLQIQHRGEWVPVKPIPNAIVVNIGDVMEAWSNGMYKSIEHRAITNEKAARISIATFIIPDNEVEFEPVDTLVDDDRPRMYKKIKYVDYLRYTMERKLDGKAHTEFLKLENYCV